MLGNVVEWSLLQREDRARWRKSRRKGMGGRRKGHPDSWVVVGELPPDTRVRRRYQTPSAVNKRVKR
jgi:hypothetical protein